MEVVEEYLNSRLSSLIKRISECEKERKSILLEVTTFKNTAGNTEAGGLFGKKVRKSRNDTRNFDGHNTEL